MPSSDWRSWRSTLSVSRKSQAQEPSGKDYLSPKLRQDVDRIKRDAERQPTDARSAVERGLILWDWVNAYSLTGGPIPVNSTQQLAPVFELRDAQLEGGTARPRAGALPKNIDELLYEFRIKDETPKAIPTISVDKSGPFPASSWQTIAQTLLTCGSAPIEPGASIMLARMLMSDGGVAQIQNAAADNYVAIRCSNPRVHFTKTTIPWAGMHGGFRGEAENAVYKVAGESLQPADTVTLVYGDRSGGSRGFQMPSFSNDKFLLPVYVGLKADGYLLTLAWPAIAVAGNQVAAVKVFAPSIVRPGERFELSVRSEDDRWNRATGSIPGYELELNGRHRQDHPRGRRRRRSSERSPDRPARNLPLFDPLGRWQDRRRKQSAVGGSRSEVPYLLG